MAVKTRRAVVRRPLAFRSKARPRLTLTGLLAPASFWLALFFLVPVGFVAAYSFGVGTGSLSLSFWGDFFNGSVYLDNLFWKSIRMSLIVSVSCVILAYPVAYFLALCAGKRKYVLLLIILAPFLTSYLLRVFAWKVILGDQGVINSFAYWTGLRDPDDPIPALIYSQFTVMIVLLYTWIPFVALPIFVALENLDRRLLEAASDLGASRWQAFVRVTLPLSLPGVAAAFLFVFIPTIGEFVTPLLVGGNGGFMFGNAISDLFLSGFDWQTGSVLAFFLLAVVFALMAIFARFLHMRRITSA